MNQKNQFSSLKLDFSETTVRSAIMAGCSERRYISKIKVNPSILRDIFNSVSAKKISFNLMMITTDQKVFLLERSQSFHFPKVIRDLKCNKINFDLIESLYTSELEKIRNLFFSFIPPLPELEKTIKVKQPTIVHIFPGGHPSYNETVILTLLRELYEETSININFKDLRFNQSYMFKVSIYDWLIQRTFENFVFPVKVNMSSHEIVQKFQETKHTRNPTFIDICQCNSLFDAFVRVQDFMLL
jgi:hypothetical protein